MNKNSVKFLRQIDFIQLPFVEKMQIKNLGPDKPSINIGKNFKIKFNPDFYTKHKWLTGCPENNALYCFPCLLFGNDKTWTKTGVVDFTILSEMIEKHEESLNHIKHVIDLAMLGSVKLASHVSKTYRQERNKFNEKIKKNRELLSKMIDSLRFCGKFEFPFPNPEEDLHSDSFLELLEYAGRMDESLRIHFLNSTIFKGKCRNFQNELLSCILEVCLEEICNEIKQAKFVSLLADDISDVTEHTQHVIVFRYLLNGTVRERLWGFFTPKSNDVVGQSECIAEQLYRVLEEDKNKLISQSYDGSFIMTGPKGSVPFFVKRMYKNAHFVHYYGHELYSTMEKAASQNPQARIFFSRLAGIPQFFNNFPNRLAELNKICLEKGIFRLCDFEDKLIYTIYEKKDILKQVLGKLQFSKNLVTVRQASGLLKMLDEEEFNWWLSFFYHIMPCVEELYTKLIEQNSSTVIEEFQEEINQAIKGFYPAIEENICPGKKRKLEDYVIYSKEIGYYLFCEANERFAFNGHLIASKLFTPSWFQENELLIFPMQEIEETAKAYPFIDKEKLKIELSVLYGREEFRCASGPLKILDIVTSTGISETCKEVTTLLQIIITTPMPTTEPDRCFETLKKIKDFLKQSKSVERISSCAMLAIEKELIENIKNFNEKVIDKFASKINRCLDFKYK